MLRDAFRKCGLLVGSVLAFTGGGLSFVYGLLLLYGSSPGGPTPGEAVAPLNELFATFVFTPVTLAVVVLALIGFTWEVQANGLLNIDDRLLVEKKKDWRRELAEQRDAWDPPEEDVDGDSMYDVLRDQVDAGGIRLLDHELLDDEETRVRGRAKNVSEQIHHDVRVRVHFLDRNEDRVGSTLASRNRIDPKHIWQFEVFYDGNMRIEGYEITDPESRTAGS